eukprot:CAMPEP_0206585440 /NCGR_PEP_ID=MMETSP0325_2-20121206/36423_1 /ASSEMBLY_ACC=CAM_ASM_000347 /TAXON_ID=2866 /ORGANISM="Crypthecodinium cohnii, Strain Seligo" /LENGTH=62 /DNA_ID=CAMNT_0054092997 /DNA_START=173 /DNA_END=357 /DNA_ORIENTATION=+
MTSPRTPLYKPKTDAGELSPRNRDQGGCLEQDAEAAAAPPWRASALCVFPPGPAPAPHGMTP